MHPQDEIILMGFFPKRFIFFVMLLGAMAWGQSKLELYVLNRPFAGKVWLNKSVLHAEAAPLFRALKIEVVKETEKSISVSRDGKEVLVPVVRKGKKAFVSVKEAAKALDLQYQFNPQTRIVDLFRIHVPPPDSQGPSSPSRPDERYRLDIVKTEEAKGIDEMAVYVTLQNKGDSVPGVAVTCEFTDEDRNLLDKQTKTVGNLAPDEKITVYFKIFYPKKFNASGYREYNTRIRYNISLAYSGQP